jgi:hypothetical protein
MKPLPEGKLCGRGTRGELDKTRLRASAEAALAQDNKGGVEEKK